MSKKSLSKSQKTGLTPRELYAIDGPHAMPDMISAIISKHYCQRIQSIGKCHLPCHENEVCRANIPDMMLRLANANNRAALLTWLCREVGEKEKDKTQTAFAPTIGEFGERTGDVLDWDVFTNSTGAPV